jgi:transposase-like protein
MEAKVRELNPAEEACAQHMSLAVVAKLGSRLAARDVGVCASLLWKWSRGRSSPTKAKFRELQRVYEQNRGER